MKSFTHLQYELSTVSKVMFDMYYENYLVLYLTATQEMNSTFVCKCN